MNIHSKLVRYNELTEAWNKGCIWAEQERSVAQNEKGLARLNEILAEISKLYTEIESYGIKVQAGVKLDLKEGK